MEKIDRVSQSSCGRKNKKRTNLSEWDLMGACTKEVRSDRVSSPDRASKRALSRSFSQISTPTAKQS